jgi:hypothetical protein
MDYFTKWPEVYAILAVTEALVTNSFWHFGIPRYSDSDFESRLMQEVIPRLEVSNAHITPLHPQSEGMIERHIRTVE